MMKLHCGVHTLVLSFFMLMLSFTSNAEQSFVNFEACNLQSGSTISPCKIGYRTFGTLNADKSNAVLVPTWYGGTSKEHIYLADADYIDPKRFFIIIVDALGNGISSSPSNSLLQPAESFPLFTIEDMVASQYRLLTEKLGIKQLYAVVGLSMGAMQTLQWAVQYPDMTTRYAAIIGTPRLASFDIAKWSTRIRLLAWYLKCQCQTPIEIMMGMQMLDSVPSRLTKDVSRTEVDNVIVKRAQETKLSSGQAWDKIRQAQAMLTHNIANKFDDDMVKASKIINNKLLIVVSADDRVVTPEPAKNLATLTKATFVELDKDCGHGDPWCDPENFSLAITHFLKE